MPLRLCAHPPPALSTARGQVKQAACCRRLAGGMPRGRPTAAASGAGTAAAVQDEGDGCSSSSNGLARYRAVAAEGTAPSPPPAALTDALRALFPTLLGSVTAVKRACRRGMVVVNGAVVADPTL